MDTHLVERLAALPSLSKVPRKELEWLVAHGTYETHDVGLLGPKGYETEYLWIILSGHFTIIIDRGIGPKMVTEWQSGQVIGKLPYSRMTGGPGDTFTDESAEAVKIHEKSFPQMIKICPVFTAFCVHSMLDRVRIFNTSDLQDEKTLSMGKLASGLAHELNNPASATVRDAKLLRTAIDNLNMVWRTLSGAGLSDEQYNTINKMRDLCLRKFDKGLPTPIEKSDHQDKIAHWLKEEQMDSDLAVPLSDTNISIAELNKLKKTLDSKALDTVLKWIVANCSVQTLSADMENSANQIYKLVEVVKKFTYMDNLTEKEFLDVEEGLRHTIRVLDSKIKLKKATVNIKVDNNLPKVHVNGGELNQVWLNLIDNALDAISTSGHIGITASYLLNRVVVCIVDNGPGIASDIIDKIFDPFFTTKPPGQGTGLGLDLTRRLLKRYKGDISVQSNPGITEFRVSLIAGTPQPVSQ